MKKPVLLIVITSLFSHFLFLDTNAADTKTEAMQSIQISHIEGNVPDNKDFDKYLTHDLRSFFSKRFNKNVNIKYEMLRDGPTQTGTAYPKYYLWVKVFNQSSLIVEGAVRVAAIEKTHFEITTFLSKDEINKNPQNVANTFPKALYEMIIARAK